MLYALLSFLLGRAIVQAVSRWLPTAAVRFRARSGHVGFVLRVLRFPLPFIIPPNSPYSLPPGAGTIGQLVADLPSGPIWTPRPIIRIKKILYFKGINGLNSSVSEVIGHGLDGQCSITSRRIDYSPLHRVQIASEAHPSLIQPALHTLSLSVILTIYL
jgi:hypothetical protein